MADTAYIDGLHVNNQDFVQFTDTTRAIKDIANGEDYLKSFQPGRNGNSSLFKLLTILRKIV